MRTTTTHRTAVLLAAAGVSVGVSVIVYGSIGCGAAGGTYSPLVGSVARTVPTPSFSVTLSPPSATVAQGATATYTVTFTSINGFSGSITPVLSGLPLGAAGSFGSVNIVPTASGVSTTLGIATSAVGDSVTPIGSSTISITCTGGGLTQTAGARLTVKSAPSFALSVSPGNVTVVQGSSAHYTVTFTALSGFTGVITPAVSGLPTGAMGQFGASSITPTGAGATTTLTVATTESGESVTPLGTSTFTITGTAAGATQNATAQLTVQAPGSLVGTIQ